MLSTRRDEGLDTKFYFSHSLLPSYIDPHNVSSKKKPFSTFNAQPFSHTLDLILPEEIYELVCAQLEQKDGVARGVYARVFMKLGELLEGDFFSEYIKKGNIMMLSEGRPLVDNIFSLYEGILRLELNRSTYERCGLQGKPIEDGGKKHQKARWIIEYDLRTPSMTHGKKAFSRLEWACKNVLNQSLTWLFYNFNPSSRESLPAGKEPISVHHPFIHHIEPTVTKVPQTTVPKLTTSDLTALYSQEDALDLYEYLNLFSLPQPSPRLSASDYINPHLSRYEVPDFDGGVGAKNMVRVRWKGFLAPQVMREIYLMVRREGLKIERDKKDGEGGTQSGSEERWIGLSAVGFGGNSGWTVMQWAGRETLVWECDA